MLVAYLVAERETDGTIGKIYEFNIGIDESGGGTSRRIILEGSHGHIATTLKTSANTPPIQVRKNPQVGICK